MLIVNTHEAKSRLSELLQRVENGEDVLIARAGRPVARLTPVAKQPRKPGYLSQEFRLPDNFDAGDEEIAQWFERSELFPPTP
mgnify:CR=1 FL=1